MLATTLTIRTDDPLLLASPTHGARLAPTARGAGQRTIGTGGAEDE